MSLAPSQQPVRLGTSDLAARPLAWSFRPSAGTTAEAAGEAVAAAVRAGFGIVSVSDVAPPGSDPRFGAAERLLGEALAATPDADLLLTLKGGVAPGPIYDNRADALEAAVCASLARLGRAQLDLFVLQRADHLTHPRDVALALSRLVERQLARAVGVAHHAPARIRAISAHLDSPLAVIELPFSALEPGALFDGSLELAMETGAAVIAAAPLAEGLIGDRPGLAGSVTARAVLRALDAIAGQQGVTRAAVAAAFVAVHPARPIPLFGTQDGRELAAAADLFRVRLARADWYRILEAALGEKLPGADLDR
ncbi:MAG: aldo/keto reductase [Sphingomonadaceae bacterium]